jgi:hypothetical protein
MSPEAAADEAEELLSGGFIAATTVCGVRSRLSGEWVNYLAESAPGGCETLMVSLPWLACSFFRGLVVVVVVIMMVMVVVFAPGCICIPGQIGQKIEKLTCLADKKTVRRQGRGSAHSSALCLGRTNN